MKALVVAAIAFVGAALLAVLLPSTWPLLVARVLLICLGVVVVVISLRKRRRSA
jgi:putative Mn2+ efflux pump MntP